MENKLEEALESKFFCSSKFAQEIENLVLDNSEMNYIDAILHFCEKNNIEVESVSKLISKPLKEKIKSNAIDLNFLKKTSRAKIVF
jgi:Holliday junction resolvasome RuvABC ATP-dependent DNA helicase subunit